MKKLFLIVPLLFFSLIASAQAQQSTRSVKIDQNTVVKDSAGVILPFAQWQKLLQSNKYRLIRMDANKETSEFQLLSADAVSKLIRQVPAPAQQMQAAQPTHIINATESSVVRDSSGTIYPFIIWQKLVSKGDYWLKTIDPAQENPEFVLVAYTEEQKANRFNNSPRPADSKFFTTGGAIKPFKIKDLNGKKIEVKDWVGKTVVLNFWFIGCPPCRAEIPDLNKLALKYKDNPNVIFIAVALDEYWQVGDYVKQNPLAYHLVGDGRYTAGMFGITLYPTNLVINKQGKVALHYSGGYPQGPYWIDKTIQESEAAKAEM